MSKNPTRQRGIILNTLISHCHPLLEISNSDVRVLKTLAANTVVVSIDSQPLVRISFNKRPLLVHARLSIAQAVAVARVVDDVFDVAGAVGRRVARGVGVHELVHESGGQRAHVPACPVAELGAVDVSGRGGERQADTADVEGVGGGREVGFGRGAVGLLL